MEGQGYIVGTTTIWSILLVQGRNDIYMLGNVGSWIQQLDNSGIQIKNAHYTVSFELLPCDQMFLTIMAGELFNSATSPRIYYLKNFPSPIQAWSCAKRLYNAAKVICTSTDLLLLHNFQGWVFSAHFLCFISSGSYIHMEYQDSLCELNMPSNRVLKQKNTNTFKINSPQFLLYLSFLM